MPMNRIGLSQWSLSFALTFLIVGMAIAGEPQDQFRQTTDQVLAILSDPALKSPDKTKERRELILKAIDERFDWEEMARRSLARHWAQRTPDERKEFIRLFKDLLERVYMDKVDGNSWDKVLYEGEQIDGDYAVLKVKVLTSDNQSIQVEYRMRKRDNRWLVYDFIVEGVGLVNNYRIQFNEIILKTSYQELVKRLKAKTTSN